jgi:hypothetical protein
VGWWEECYKRCGGGRSVIRGGLLYNGMELYIHYKFTSLSQLIFYFNIYCWLLTTKLSPLIWIWFLDSYLKCYELKTCQIAQEFHQSVCYKLCWLSSQYQSGSHNIALQLLSVDDGPSLSWSYNYLCNQCPSPLRLWVQIPLKRGVLPTTLCGMSVVFAGYSGFLHQ